MRRAHEIALVAYCALLALVEGPAEVACAIAVITSLSSLRYKDRTTLAIASLIGLWALSGVFGVLTTRAHLRSEDVLRPLLALGFVVGAFGLRRADDALLKRSAIAFCSCIVFNGAYGFLQLAFGELPWDRLFLKNPASSQLWVPGHVLDPTSRWPTGVRALSGLFYNRLKLAHLGVIGLGALSLIAIARGQTRRTRVLATSGAAVLFTAMIFTYARAALGAFVVAALVLVLVSMRARVAAIFLGGSTAALAVALSLSSFFRERLENAAGDFELRRQIFAAAVRMFAEHPLFGLGHGVYRTEAAAYYPSGASSTWTIDAHNLLLHVAAETGIVGTVGFFGALALALARVLRRVRRDRLAGTPGAVLDRTALFGLTAILVLGLTHFPLHHAPVALAFWTLLGVAGGRERSDGEE